MTRKTPWSWALAASVVIAGAALAPATARADEDACYTHSYDTTVDWHESGKVAARIAAEQDRLVCVLHLSGELPDAGLT